MIPCTCPQNVYPPLFKSLSYATSLLGKTYISTCFCQWKEIRRGFPLLRKKAKSLQLQFCKWVEPIYQGFPDSSVGKESACNAGDPGSIPGSERSAGEGISYLLQHSWGSLVAQLVKRIWPHCSTPGLIPELGRSSGEGKSYPFQEFWPGLYSPWGRRVGLHWATVTFTFEPI